MAGSGSNPNPEKDRLSSSPSPSEASAKRHRILVVEDNKADVFLIREAIEAAELNADLEVVPDGEKAISFFNGVDSDDTLACPVLVILDINLPKRHGDEVLQQMRSSRRCGNALVLVVTSSDSQRDRETMASLGVNGYFRKPSDFEEFMKLGALVKKLVSELPAS